ncbi:MAG: prolipoprotein diacylglyceryl transferase [Conexibacter sp.]|jgi:prolipoprotein diacylglyceryl transferase|nr:prolipoprotein diacylglyceryl transferase [Conexibacter sp.]
MLAAIPSPSSNGIHLGPLTLHVYGLMYVLAVIAAIVITSRRWRARGGDPELVQRVALVGFPAGLIGGRIYFLVTSWDQWHHTWWGPFAVWDGGLGIWGGIAGGAIGGIWVLRRNHVDVPAFMDAVAPALLVAQGIGRIGNWFNQELFGGPTSLPWGLEIDPQHRPAAFAHDATFQPTFLYELIWDFSLAAALAWLGKDRRIRPPGLFALYVAGYSGFRIFEELLRVDPSHHLLGLRLNFWIAGALTLGGLAWFVRSQRQMSANAGKEQQME